jgi:hypothetical protein
MMTDRRYSWLTAGGLAVALLTVPATGRAQAIPGDYQGVLTTLGRTGDFKDNVLKVNIPRGDLRVTIRQRPVPTPFGFGGWVAFTKAPDGMDVMMGDLVLTEDEVNPVMSALLTEGLQVTALHNHFFWEQPRIFYMHVHGMGRAAEIATKLKPAIEIINRAIQAAPAPAPAAAPAAAPIDGAALARIVGHDGEQNGSVYKITIGRPDVDLREHGAVINARMGFNTWAAFTGTPEEAMVAGDVAMLESELPQVLKVLRANNINIVAIHHHMTEVKPVVIFLHYFGTGPAETLARAVRAAVDQLGRSPTPPQTPAGGRGGAPVGGAEPDIPLVARFDKDGNHRLDYAERTAAREYLAAHPEMRRPARGGRNARTGSPGPKLAPKDVMSIGANVPLYDAGTVRTVFLQFDRDDWEQELAAFWHTDVQVPATVIVDGKTYADVGVSFSGNNSFTAVPDGLKRSLTLSLDFVHATQQFLGYRTLHLLNSNQDPTFLRSVLYMEVARDYLPALKANLMRVVINGESWGVYASQQAFNKDFLRDAFKTIAGTQWKSPNNSTGGGLSYLGEDVALYRRWYEMKGTDDPAAWTALIRVCRMLNQTPPEQLAQALAPIMDVDGALKFLALDVALINNDGYWNDGSDFNLYLDGKGLLHLTPHDANEGFRGGGRGGVQLDPLTTLDDPNKALRSKLLAVPSLRTRYLTYVGDIAEKWLDWKRLGPIVEQYQKLIAGDVARDTRKLDSTEAFTTGVYGDGNAPPSGSTLKGFADQRRAFLLAHPEIVKARGR